MNDDETLGSRIYGYSPGQWATVLRHFPPKEATIKGLAESRRNWLIAHVLEPGEAPVTGRYMYHWGRFVGGVRRQMGMAA